MGQASVNTWLVPLGTPCSHPSVGSAVWPQGIVFQQLLVPIQICEPGPLRNGQKETLRSYYYLICPKWQLLYLVFMRIFSLWTTKSASIPIARLERAPGKHPGDFLISIDQATLYSSV